MPNESSISEEILEEHHNSLSDFIFKNRIYLAFILLGLIFLGSGFFLFKNSGSDSELEVIDTESKTQENSTIYVEVTGAITTPGVYSLSSESRVEDALVKAGGLSVDADRVWLEKYMNRAAKLTDGQKIYIPRVVEHSNSPTASNLDGDSGDFLGTSDSLSNMVNINTAGQKELETLPGIGPVYAQSIIDHRPYSSIEDLVSKDAIKTFVFEKIKDRVTVY